MHKTYTDSRLKFLASERTIGKSFVAPARLSEMNVIGSGSLELPLIRLRVCACESRQQQCVSGSVRLSLYRTL